MKKRNTTEPKQRQRQRKNKQAQERTCKEKTLKLLETSSRNEKKGHTCVSCDLEMHVGNHTELNNIFQ